MKQVRTYYRSATAEHCCIMCHADASSSLTRGRQFSGWNYQTTRM